ncbi:MAG: T9SS type A sorting domain-containing protein [Ignavibacteria bacterium]|nr:T9SS type A sorting domain-containing protein [Ignavibacteria bacterium]
MGINFINFFSSLEGWYSYYRFASNVNLSYQVFRKDTTVTIDSTTLPLRFELIGKRLADETINTAIGTFACKKFLLERRLSYLVTIPPFPTIAIKILGVEETVWLALDNWKVKSYIPSTNVDLSILGIPDFNVPGLETNITTPITDVEDGNEVVKDFELYQNYPNPFNPSTKISWQSPISGWQTLKVYDILGNEIATLVDEYKPAGNYEVEFNVAHESLRASGISAKGGYASGVYFYQLKVNNFVQSKKMVLLK